MLAEKKPLPGKAFSEQAQSPIEIIGIAVMLVGLLLLVIVTTAQKNVESREISEMASNSIQCNKISSAIARLYNNRANSMETVLLETEATLRRVAGTDKPGGINVDGQVCYYVGMVKVKDQGQYDTDVDGITLSTGNWCFEKQSQSSYVEVSEGWCT